MHALTKTLPFLDQFFLYIYIYIFDKFFGSVQIFTGGLQKTTFFATMPGVEMKKCTISWDWLGSVLHVFLLWFIKLGHIFPLLDEKHVSPELILHPWSWMHSRLKEGTSRG